MGDKNLHLYSEREKYANNKQWFKDFIDAIEKRTYLTLRSESFSEFEKVTTDVYHNMKINYNLYNDKIDEEDFLKYCTGIDYKFSFPENFSHWNIVSDKIKVMEGLEMGRPFYSKVIAVNPEATTRKEQHRFGKMKEFVVQQIMAEIEKQERLKQEQQTKGRKLTPQEEQELEQQLQQKVQAMTPDEVKRYMERKYQDPAEVLASQMLEYLMYKEEIRLKFNKGWKHSILSGNEFYHVWIDRGEPRLDVVNPLYFDYDRNTESGFPEDGEWAVATYNFSLIDIIRRFPSLSKEDLNSLSEQINVIDDDYFTFDETTTAVDLRNYVTATHYVWKSIRKIGFLTYIDAETGNIEEKIVDESYKLQPQYGDIELVKGNIVEVYEGWKLGNTDIYANLRRVPYIRDLDDLNNVKLPYLGGIYDNDNSTSVSLMERMKGYQYLYDIVINKLQMLMSSDKGSLLLMNIDMIPKSQNIDVEKWMYYASKTHVGFVSPKEEGTRTQDVTTAAKVLDLSTSSDIQRYVQLASYLEERCGNSVGITPQIVGRIGANEAVGNTQQSIQQSSYILEPYFSFHNVIKRNVLNYLLNTARLAYSIGNKKHLTYTLDDLSQHILKIDKELLTFNTFGIFISNNVKPDELKNNIVQLAHAALQNQSAEFSDIISVLKTDNPTEAEEILKVAEQKAKERESQLEDMKMRGEQEKINSEREFELTKLRLEYENDMKIAELKAKTEIEKELLKQAGLQDKDNDGIPDALELAKLAQQRELNEKKMKLEEKKLESQTKLQKEKLELEKKKLKKGNNEK